MVEASPPSLTCPPASPALGSTSWGFVVFVHVRSGHWSKAGSCVDGAVDLFFLLSSPPRTSPAVVIDYPELRRLPDSTSRTLLHAYRADLETAVVTPMIDYIDNDPSFLPEQPGGD
ncbi:uncharacterized protein LOC125518817 [Triticum urartu]|uniref:uncharacterized protein LOC125518817 n=1 Tax=Triticum urartu TaxID=4572 RepID=UPI0020442234|nr:uncharacterized protein LOC125518817 [Triticum urartu]